MLISAYVKAPTVGEFSTTFNSLKNSLKPKNNFCRIFYSLNKTNGHQSITIDFESFRDSIKNSLFFCKPVCFTYIYIHRISPFPIWKINLSFSIIFLFLEENSIRFVCRRKGFYFHLNPPLPQRFHRFFCAEKNALHFFYLSNVVIVVFFAVKGGGGSWKTAWINENIIWASAVSRRN